MQHTEHQNNYKMIKTLLPITKLLKSKSNTSEQIQNNYKMIKNTTINNKIIKNIHTYYSN